MDKNTRNKLIETINQISNPSLLNERRKQKGSLQITDLEGMPVSTTPSKESMERDSFRFAPESNPDRSVVDIARDPDQNLPDFMKPFTWQNIIKKIKNQAKSTKPDASKISAEGEVEMVPTEGDEDATFSITVPWGYKTNRGQMAQPQLDGTINIDGEPTPFTDLDTVINPPEATGVDPFGSPHGYEPTTPEDAKAAEEWRNRHNEIVRSAEGLGVGQSEEGRKQQEAEEEAARTPAVAAPAETTEPTSGRKPIYPGDKTAIDELMGKRKPQSEKQITDSLKDTINQIINAAKAEEKPVMPYSERGDAEPDVDKPNLPFAERGEGSQEAPEETTQETQPIIVPPGGVNPGLFGDDVEGRKGAAKASEEEQRKADLDAAIEKNKQRQARLNAQRDSADEDTRKMVEANAKNLGVQPWTLEHEDALKAERARRQQAVKDREASRKAKEALESIKQAEKLRDYTINQNPELAEPKPEPRSQPTSRPRDVQPSRTGTAGPLETIGSILAAPIKGIIPTSQRGNPNADYRYRPAATETTTQERPAPQTQQTPQSSRNSKIMITKMTPSGDWQEVPADLSNEDDLRRIQPGSVSYGQLSPEDKARRDALQESRRINNYCQFITEMTKKSFSSQKKTKLNEQDLFSGVSDKPEPKKATKPTKRNKPEAKPEAKPVAAPVVPSPVVKQEEPNQVLPAKIGKVKYKPVSLAGTQTNVFNSGATPERLPLMSPQLDLPTPGYPSRPARSSPWSGNRGYIPPTTQYHDTIPTIERGEGATLKTLKEPYTIIPSNEILMGGRPLTPEPTRKRVKPQERPGGPTERSAPQNILNPTVKKVLTHPGTKAAGLAAVGSTILAIALSGRSPSAQEPKNPQKVGTVNTENTPQISDYGIPSYMRK